MPWFLGRYFSFSSGDPEVNSLMNIFTISFLNLPNMRWYIKQVFLNQNTVDKADNLENLSMLYELKHMYQLGVWHRYQNILFINTEFMQLRWVCIDDIWYFLSRIMTLEWFPGICIRLTSLYRSQSFISFYNFSSSKYSSCSKNNASSLK